YFERAAAFLYDRIGKEHVISAIVHMDETSPHMHLCFFPITKDGRLSAKDILGNRARMSEWQDDFYEYMHGFYPELERGLPSAITHRKHIPPYLFRAMDNASKSYDAIMKALSDVNVFNAGKKRDEAERVLGQFLPDLYKLQAQSRLIDEQAKALREAIKEKDALLEEQDTELFALACKVDALQAEKDKAVATIEMIPPDLRRALEEKRKQHGKER
ncbi:MAG: plasmid recombination protein, partial [Firmicutes bacterium]|nr:plasmid recombination protein [Bacillota bacterium]